MKHATLPLCTSIFAACLMILGLAWPAFAESERLDGVSSPPIAQKRVFGWYLMCYHNSVERYRHHIDLARRNGIDGFILDIFEWRRKKGDDGSPHVQSVLNMLEAARRAGPDFSFIPCPEYSIAKGAGKTHNFLDLMRRCLDHPNIHRHHDGKPIISSYVGKFAGEVAQLREEGYDFHYVPNFWSKRYANIWTLETVLRFYRDMPEIDGLTPFPTFQTQTNILTNANGLRASYFADKLFIAGVNPAYNSANLRDRRGMRGYAAMWEGVIRDNPPYVHVVTWNDYNEDSNLMPGRWPWGKEKQYISRDESYLDLTGYYSAWYRTGVQPKITQNKVYVTYRTRRLDQSMAGTRLTSNGRMFVIANIRLTRCMTTRPIGCM